MWSQESLVCLLGGLSVAVAQSGSAQDPSKAEIAKSRASVEPYSPVSNVEGLAFNRFVNIWLENTVSFGFAVLEERRKNDADGRCNRTMKLLRRIPIWRNWLSRALP